MRVVAMILAGGLGTRLRSVVADKPKVMAEVGGRPFLTYLLDWLVGGGIDEAVLCTGHLGEMIEAAMGDRYRGCRLRYSLEREPLGTAGALRLALPLVEGDVALVLNGDSLSRAQPRAFLADHERSGARGSLVVRRVADASRFGTVRFDRTGRVVAFEEKRSGGPAAGYVSAGIYLLDRALLSTIPAGRAVSLEREMLPTWVDAGLHAYRTAADFLDIGTPGSYASAAAFVRGRPD